MTAEQAAALRAGFPADRIGKLPRITCPACSKASGRCCPEHSKAKCAECDNYITVRHIHLDYCGHGAVTDRLLEVDPFWSWEPLAFDPQTGMPVFIEDKNLNPIRLWIKLTVCGVTRLGVGTCESGQHDAEKVLIGDALRNAAMRFGVALDLWIKGHAEDDERTTTEQANAGRETASVEDTVPAASRETVIEIKRLLSSLTESQSNQAHAWAQMRGFPTQTERFTAPQGDEALAYLRGLKPEKAKPEPTEKPQAQISDFEAHAKDMADKAERATKDGAA